MVRFKPIAAMDLHRETPASVVSVADAEQISVLVILGNYARQGMKHMIDPWAAGCQTIGLRP